MKHSCNVKYTLYCYSGATSVIQGVEEDQNFEELIQVDLSMTFDV
jgi:hypothetical protein